MSDMLANALDGGFTDAPRDSAHAFRAVMEAMARPGRIVTLAGATAPAPVSPAAATVLLTLCDPDTPLWLAPSHDSPALRAWLAFHTGAPVATPQTCSFALGTWPSLLPVDRFAAGTPEYPDRSATLIIERPTLTNDGATLTGPGIRDFTHLDLPETEAFRRNAARFPLGFDCLFTSGNRLAALPRSTRIA
jgi:alpha-D-ribose 1-methylphosphonate 5-triphosphate synthase subunit PhnH